MGWQSLGVESWPLGTAAPTARTVGSASLGTQEWWLGPGRRPLALETDPVAGRLLIGGSEAACSGSERSANYALRSAISAVARARKRRAMDVNADAMSPV